MYHQIDCCDQLLTVDELLVKYKSERNTICAKLMCDPEEVIKDLWKDDSSLPLSQDQHCLCNLGYGDYLTDFICPQCRNVGRIVDYTQENIIDSPIIIACGTRKGEEIIIRHYPHQIIRKEKNCRSVFDVRTFIAKNISLLSCGVPIYHDLDYFHLDTFSNNVIISWAMCCILKHNADNFYTAFLCGDDGYVLLDSNLPLKDFIWEEDRIFHLFGQLISMYERLKPHFFTHGTPCLTSLNISDLPVDYIVGSVFLHSPFTLQLQDFDYGSITIADKRIVPHYKGSFVFAMEQTIKKRMIKISSPYEEEKEEIITFRITPNILHIIRYSGVPIYTESFDLYCFFLAIMSVENIFNVVMESEGLYVLWNKLWLSNSDAALIESRLREVHGKNLTVEDILPLLNGIDLKCNVLKDLIDTMNLVEYQEKYIPEEYSQGENEGSEIDEESYHSDSQDEEDNND